MFLIQSKSTAKEFKGQGLMFKVDNNTLTIDFQESFGGIPECTVPWQIQTLKLIEDFFKEYEFSIPTSGTTGSSKNILVKKEHLLASAKKTNDFFDLKAGDSSLLVMNPQYIGGRMMIIRAIERKLKLTVLAPSNQALQYINQEYDFCAMVPMQVQESISNHSDQFKLIKNLIIGGGKVDTTLLQHLRSFEVNCYSTFGMTETLSHIALRQVSPVENKYFETVEGIDISIKNDCLHIDGKDIGVEGLSTKDVVRITGNGFQWLGRQDNMINSGGVKLFPEVIEEKLSESIKEAFFISTQADDKFGQIVILVIESIKTFEPSFPESLNKYEKPKRVYFINKFERTETGKIKRLNVLERLGILQ